jgi:hypothetical protein
MVNNQPADAATKRLGEMIVCGFMYLGIPSLLAIVLILILLATGIPAPAIEKWMAWLSVPWFALCYPLCKIAHGIELVIVDGEGKPIQTPSRN